MCRIVSQPNNLHWLWLCRSNSSPSDCHLFSALKQNLGCHRFKHSRKMDTAATRLLVTQHTDWYQHTTGSFVPRYDKLLEWCWNYAKELWDSSKIKCELICIIRTNSYTKKITNYQVLRVFSVGVGPNITNWIHTYMVWTILNKCERFWHSLPCSLSYFVLLLKSQLLANKNI